MVDPLFFEPLGPLPASAFADLGLLEGDRERTIAGVAALGEASLDDLAFHDGKAPKEGVASGAGLLILGEGTPASSPGARLRCRFPRAAFSAAARRLFQERAIAPGADIDSSVQLEEGVRIGPQAVIGAGARIGAGAEIGAGAVIGPGVAIGRRSRIGARVVLACTLVGDEVTILPGALIGQSGFGVAPGPQGPVDVVQLGRVLIQDRATIGAGVTIDRGALGDTLIGEDAKIDNLCHIAHNVQVGRAVVMAAFAGISGSVTIGDGVMMGGRVGIADHVTIGAGARLAAGAALMHNIPPGETWGGYPARPLRRWMREDLWLRRAAAGERQDDK